MSWLSDIWPLYTCNYQWVDYLIFDHYIPVYYQWVDYLVFGHYIPVTTNELTIWYLATRSNDNGFRPGNMEGVSIDTRLDIRAWCKDKLQTYISWNRFEPSRSRIIITPTQPGTRENINPEKMIYKFGIN